jgi:hypothetical protein
MSPAELYHQEKNKRAGKDIQLLCPILELRQEERRKHPRGGQGRWDDRRTDLCSISECVCGEGIRSSLSSQRRNSSVPSDTGEFRIIPPTLFDADEEPMMM